MFEHIRTGEFLSIKNGKVAYFIPFYNVSYENDWHNLYDIDAKFADVESVDTCLDYLAQNSVNSK